MYVLGTTNKISWVISTTTSTIVLSDLDLILINPEGIEVYLSSPILSANFTAPTTTVDGLASYDFTPDMEGLWKIRLVTGTEASYTQLSRIEMQVLDNSTTTNPVATYIKTKVTSEAIKVPCVAATTANITLSGLQTVDTVVLSAGDRVLVKDQTTTTENGLYNVVDGGAWTRTADFNEDYEVTNGVIVLDSNIGVVYAARFTTPLDIGITAITFDQIAISAAELADLTNQVGYATEWASKAEDVNVSVAAGGGTSSSDYSALHFAAKANADAIQTAADRVQTGNDASTTTTNASTTNDNVIITNDDVTTTNSNAATVSSAKDAIDLAHLGPKSSAPTTLNDGTTTLTSTHNGIRYWNTGSLDDWTWNGSSWGLTSTSVATNANAVIAVDSGGYFSGGDLESVTQEIGSELAIYDQIANAFYVHEAATPDMTFIIEAGNIQNGISLTEKSLQTATGLTAPATNPRIDRIVINRSTGGYSVITGTEASSPVAPALTVGFIAVARILLQTTTTAITNSMITDERAFITDNLIVGVDVPVQTILTDRTDLVSAWDTITVDPDAKFAFVVASLIMTGSTTANVGTLTAYVRKKGLSGNPGASERFAQAGGGTFASTGSGIYGSGSTLVECDSNGSFEAYGYNNTSGTTTQIKLTVSAWFK